MRHRRRIVLQRRRADDVDDDGDREGKENGKGVLTEGEEKENGVREYRG